MCNVIVFGGTTEGRLLARSLSERQIPALVCVATEYGEEQLDTAPTVVVRVGRMEQDDMQQLLLRECPSLVIDATHPFATVVSRNIKNACTNQAIRYLRVVRQPTESLSGCHCFQSMEQLLAFLDSSDNIIFSTMGAKEAAALATLRAFEKRVYLRILPDAKGLASCVALGYPKQHLICMQGPFSQTLNAAMFAEVGAGILVTKQSGDAGGFAEKIAAAKQCGMTAAVLLRPPEQEGVSIERAIAIIEEEIK